MMKARISKKSLKGYPPNVQVRIREVAGRFGIKSAQFYTVPVTREFYSDEDDRYWGIRADGTEAYFEVVAAHNLGASGLSMRIGSRFTMPVGSFLIQVYYYNQYFMTVCQIVDVIIQQPVLPGKE